MFSCSSVGDFVAGIGRYGTVCTLQCYGTMAFYALYNTMSLWHCRHSIMLWNYGTVCTLKYNIPMAICAYYKADTMCTLQGKVYIGRIVHLYRRVLCTVIFMTVYHWSQDSFISALNINCPPYSVSLLHIFSLFSLPSIIVSDKTEILICNLYS